VVTKVVVPGSALKANIVTSYCFQKSSYRISFGTKNASTALSLCQNFGVTRFSKAHKLRKGSIMKVFVRNASLVVSALILNVLPIAAHAGITGTDPRPQGSVAPSTVQKSVVLGGITGTDPRPQGSLVAGITGTDPRPQGSVAPSTVQKSVVLGGITGTDPRPQGSLIAGITGTDPRPQGSSLRMA
jgi:hypothetical protein